jgi:hypothetical protein
VLLHVRFMKLFLTKLTPNVIDGLIEDWERYTGQEWDDSYLDEDPYEGYEAPPAPEPVGYVYDEIEDREVPIYETPEDGTTVYDEPGQAEECLQR